MTAQILRFGTRPPRWRRRLGLLMRDGRVLFAAELATLLVLLVMVGTTVLALKGSAQPQRPVPPPVVALLLLGNLLPAMVLLVLIAGRIARRRAERSPVGRRGQMHVRLVALFSVLAALPTLLVSICASLLFQYGVQFWFSDKARAVLTNADLVAQTYVEEHRRHLADQSVSMANDILNAMADARPNDPRWKIYFASQVYYRSLDQAFIVRIAPNGRETVIFEGSNNDSKLVLDDQTLNQLVPKLLLPKLADNRPHVRILPDRLEAVIRLGPGSRHYLYMNKSANSMVLAQAARANNALNSYRSLAARARSLQLQLNLALVIVSLLIVAAAIWLALLLADRLVRPIGELVGAARSVAGGDLAVRVQPRRANDEIGTLAAAFNRMTRRLQEQTGALESRRALTEAVLSAVSAGVVSVNQDGIVAVANPTANALLHTEGASAVGARLKDLAPELASVIENGEREAVVELGAGGDARTLAVTLRHAGAGHVLTFDDITQQLADQRRAAWADVARRIAHEIKNPLTPIQLAAERLQRRYGREIADESGTFERLVSTIVRQVGDIRRMIDEFSSFARMPKPSFARADVAEIARQAVFLHEVAHPAITFGFDAPHPHPQMVCDRRQLSQAMTNLVKNAVEAVDTKGSEGGTVDVSLVWEGASLVLEVADNGIGLPADRERLTEPYMTTRAKGTGLGLAIVEKIVEEHQGQLSFADRPGGGTIVRLQFDPAVLAPLAPDPHLPEEAGEPSLVAAGSH